MPRWLLAFLFTGGIFATSYFLIRYLLKRANLKPSHKGLAVAAVSGLGVLVLSLILNAFGMDLFRGKPKMVLQVVLASLFFGLAAHMILARMRSGPELADLGPSPLRIFFLLTGILTILSGMHTLITESGIGGPIVGLAQGIWLVVMGFARSQIRDRGLYYFGGLVPWDKIVRYEWSEKSTLLVDLRQRKWWQDRLQVPVPAPLVREVDELMRSHVAA